MAFSGSHPGSILPQNLTLALVGTLSTATFSWLLSSLLLDFVPFCFRSFTQNTLSKPPSLPSFKATLLPLNSLCFSHQHHAHLLTHFLYLMAEQVYWLPFYCEQIYNQGNLDLWFQRLESRRWSKRKAAHGWGSSWEPTLDSQARDSEHTGIAAILEADPADPATHLPDKVTPPNLSRGEKPGRSWGGARVQLATTHKILHCTCNMS